MQFFGAACMLFELAPARARELEALAIAADPASLRWPAQLLQEVASQMEAQGGAFDHVHLLDVQNSHGTMTTDVILVREEDGAQYLSNFMTPSISNTLQQIGLATLLWNKVDKLWYLCFMCLMRDAARAKVDLMYRSFETGHRKRLLIRRVSELSLAEFPDLLCRMSNLLTRTDELSRTRNALVHADFNIAIDTGITDLSVSPGGDHDRRNILASQDLPISIGQVLEALKLHISDIETLLDSHMLRAPAPDNMLTTTKWVELLYDTLAKQGH